MEDFNKNKGDTMKTCTICGVEAATDKCCWIVDGSTDGVWAHDRCALIAIQSFKKGQELALAGLSDSFSMDYQDGAIRAEAEEKGLSHEQATLNVKKELQRMHEATERAIKLCPTVEDKEILGGLPGFNFG
jgi:hypothetical protein